MLIFWGIFLRWNAISVASLWMDEGYSFLAADTFRKTLGITLETGFKYGKNSMLFHALQAGSMSLFGISEWALRLPSFLFGVLLILLSFFGMRKLFPKSILPFVFAVAIAFSSWEIVWSIQGRMYQMLQTLFLVSSLFSLEILFGYENALSLLFLFTLRLVYTSIRKHSLSLVFSRFGNSKRKFFFSSTFFCCVQTMGSAHSLFLSYSSFSLLEI
ncbi:glycosyltransferase family 39 protein [Candidatus Peregrinibacteria bacterium]|nr:MAG: glycosyltransferase family 39 protein [Candidatus Peregrinibacteria bacterium]